MCGKNFWKNFWIWFSIESFKRKILSRLYKWNSNPDGWQFDCSLWTVLFLKCSDLPFYTVKSHKEMCQDYHISILACLSFYFSPLVVVETSLCVLLGFAGYAIGACMRRECFCGDDICNSQNKTALKGSNPILWTSNLEFNTYRNEMCRFTWNFEK